MFKWTPWLMNSWLNIQFTRKASKKNTLKKTETNRQKIPDSSFVCPAVRDVCPCISSGIACTRNPLSTRQAAWHRMHSLAWLRSLPTLTLPSPFPLPPPTLLVLSPGRTCTHTMHLKSEQDYRVYDFPRFGLGLPRFSYDMNNTWKNSLTLLQWVYRASQTLELLSIWVKLTKLKDWKFNNRSNRSFEN